MPDDLILAHDIGTSGTKSSVVGFDGAIADSQSTPHQTYTDLPGQAEQDPSDWWSGVCRNTRALMERHPEFRTRIAGIGLSGHMLGCLPIDAEGKPLRRCMIHADRRATAESEHVKNTLGAAEVYRTTGNIVDARSSLCKALWLKRHEPEVYARTERFIQSKDFIVGCMTGSFDSTDFSDASHAQWLDIRRRRYADDLFSALGLDVARLPELHRATDVVGKVSEASAAAMGVPAGIPVVAGGGDGACATVGAGCVRPGDTYCCIGTAAWIASVAAEALPDPKMRVFNVLALDGESCAVYGTVQSAGHSLAWAMELLGEDDFSRLDSLLAGAPAGSDGLIFLPYLEGERSPIWDTTARGVFFGITTAHGREHFLRATVEGVSFALRSVLAAIRERGPIPALRLIGGGGQSAVWQQMLADICDVEIQCLSTRSEDATSLGAAIAAAVGVGAFDSMADGCRLVAIEQSRAPDAALRERYDRRFALYASLYPVLRPAFAELHQSL